MKQKLSKIYGIISEITDLPKAEVAIDCSTPAGMSIYRSFTKRHPRYLVVQNKSIGVGLIDAKEFANADGYIQSVNGKNSAAYFSRKAQRAGYVFKEIDPNQFIDAIYAVNTSAKERQGREMGASYQEKIASYPISNVYRYFGVFKNDELVAYDWIAIHGEIAIVSRLLGHAAHMKEGVMYLLITETVRRLIEENKGVKYVMYDTFFGASEGLRMFKERLGFRPYRVKWVKSNA